MVTGCVAHLPNDSPVYFVADSTATNNHYINERITTIVTPVPNFYITALIVILINKVRTII